jgi:hypothetical protein
VRHLPLITVCVLSLGLLLWALLLQDAPASDTVWAAARPEVGRANDGALSASESALEDSAPGPMSDAIQGRTAVESSGAASESETGGQHSGPGLSNRRELGPAFVVEVFDSRTGGTSTGVRTRSGRRTGLWRDTWGDGTLRRVGDYTDDEREGPWEFFYEDGAKHKEGVYLDDLRDGPWTTWHPNGERMQEATFEGGRMDGFWQEWYSNGQVKTAGRYLNGRREGWWQFFHFDGASDIRTGMYESGRRLER